MASTSQKTVSQSTPEPLLYDRRRAAAALSISIRSLDYLIASGSVRVRHIGSRVLVPAIELRRLAGEDHPGSVVG
jgi:hypothetical protein